MMYVIILKLQIVLQLMNDKCKSLENLPNTRTINENDYNDSTSLQNNNSLNDEGSNGDICQFISNMYEKHVDEPRRLSTVLSNGKDHKTDIHVNEEEIVENG